MGESQRPSIKSVNQYQRREKARAFLDAAGAEVATPAEYADWLVAHIRKGGSVTSVSADNMVLGHPGHLACMFYILRKDVKVPSLTDRDSICAIVPAGVAVHYKGTESLGENQMYFADGGYDHAEKMLYVPLSPDVVEELKKRGLGQGAIDAFGVAVETEERISAEFARHEGAKTDAFCAYVKKHDAQLANLNALLKNFVAAKPVLSRKPSSGLAGRIL